VAAEARRGVPMARPPVAAESIVRAMMVPMAEMVAGEVMTAVSMMIMSVIEMMKAVMAAAGSARGGIDLRQNETEKDDCENGEELL
jgi:hypothetical protein